MKIEKDYMPVLLMIFLEFTLAGINLLGKAALLDGMNVKVFVVYRQCIAFLVMVPMAYFKRRQGVVVLNLGWKAFGLIFLAAFIGTTLLQNFYLEGLYLASASAASAFLNSVPATTFIISYIVGLEKVNHRSWRSLTKIFGTIACVGGAIAIALFKGPKLLKPDSVVAAESGSNWMLGCALSFGGAWCWGVWLNLQVPVTKSCPDSLTLAVWTALLGAFQSAIVTLVMERDMNVWRLNSFIEFYCCIYAGLVSGLLYFAGAWCTSRRGPLFTAMFTPLVTVIVTIFACILLGEHVYIGSLAGACLVILGLYLVLWSKAKDLQEMKSESGENRAAVNGSPQNANNLTDMEQPLLK